MERTRKFRKEDVYVWYTREPRYTPKTSDINEHLKNLEQYAIFDDQDLFVQWVYYTHNSKYSPFTDETAEWKIIMPFFVSQKSISTPLLYLSVYFERIVMSIIKDFKIFLDNGTERLDYYFLQAVFIISRNIRKPKKFTFV
jgi:hypothetical protein